MSRKKALAFVTAAVMLVGNSAVFPSIAVSAAESTAVTFTKNYTASVNFTSTDTREFANLGDSNYALLGDDVTSAIAEQVKTQNGLEETPDVSVTDLKVTYDYAYTPAEGDTVDPADAYIQLFVYGGGGDADWNSVDLTFGDDGGNSIPLSDSLTGTNKTFTFSALGGTAGNIKHFYYCDLGIGGSGKQGDSLTLTVKNVEYTVEYSMPEPEYPKIIKEYNEYINAEAIKLTYDISKVGECGHEHHISEDGINYNPNDEYCPWATINVYRVSTSGVWSDSFYEVFDIGVNKPTNTITVMMKDIFAAIGTPSVGEQLVFEGSQNSVPTSVEIIDEFVLSDIDLNTGSVASAKIEEATEWTPDGNKPTGKPNLNVGEVCLANNSKETKFEGYKVLQINYTVSDPSSLSAVNVVLFGWEDNSVGWDATFYAVSGSGTITIDLTKYQDKTYHNIYVYPVAPVTAWIGETFYPGFTVTSAKMLTEYSGAFSQTIPEVKPVERIFMDYSEYINADAVKLTYSISKVGECGHENHTADDGVNYNPNNKYCPWASFFIHRISASGEWSEAGYEVYNGGVDKPTDTVTIMMKDIFAVVGTPSAGEQLVFIGNQSAAPTSVEIIDKFVLPDIDLNTGSVASATVEEEKEWTPDGGKPTGKPNLNIGQVNLAENPLETKLDGYKALQIDYTVSNPSALSAINVVLHGWEDSSVGWATTYYAVRSSGTITIDLTKYQDKTYHNIYVYPVAPATAKIGDSLAPGFTVTSAKLLTEYSGTFSATIPEVKPIENQQPTGPSNPSTPSTPPVNQNTSTSANTATEKAVEEINKAAEGTTVEVSLKGNTVADKDIFIAIAGKDIDIKVTVSGGVTIEINGKDVKNAKNVDLDVKMNSKAIKEERVNEIAEDKDTVQFSLKHNGDFGFKAKFNLPVSKKYNGKYANIYWDNKGNLEFVGSSMVSNGKVGYWTEHASDYVMVFDDHAYGEDVSSASGIYAGGEDAENTPYKIIAVFTLILGVSAVTVKKFIVKSK